MEIIANEDGNAPRIQNALEDLENTNPTLLVSDDDKDRDEVAYPVFFPSMKAATLDSIDTISGPDSPDLNKDSSSTSASHSGGGDLEQQEKRAKRSQGQQDQSSHKRTTWICFCIAVAFATAATIAAILLLSDRKETTVNMNEQFSETSSPVSSSTDNDDLAIPTVAPIGTQSPVSSADTMTLAPINLTAAPTQAPTHPATTNPPTTNPTTPSPITPLPSTAYPSSAPTSNRREDLIFRLSAAGIVIIDEDDSMTGDATRVDAILNFLVEELVAMQDDEEASAVFLQDIPQRYAMLSLDWQISGYENIVTGSKNRIVGTSFLASRLFVHECSWPGVVCGEGTRTVHRLEWGHRNANDGGVLGKEIGILQSLDYLDASNNLLQGTIPEELYALVNLESVYLYKNKLKGTISSSIGNLWKLRTWHSSHNQLSGSIPETLRSGSEIRPLHTLNLYSNNMNGTFPENLRLRRLFHLDLGRNSFDGQLPADFADKSAALRLFHIDHNRFSGEIPPIYSQIGSGRVVSFSIDNNRFWGRPPVEDLQFRNVLVSYTMHNNDFSVELDKDFCKQSVFEGGEMVEMKADCDICSCRDIFCDACVD